MHITAKDMIKGGISPYQSVQLSHLAFDKFKNPKTDRNIDLTTNEGMLEAWQIAVKEIFTDTELNKLTDRQRDVFAQYMYKAIYQNWNKERFGNPPTYIPDQEKLKNTNESILMKKLDVSNVDELHELSVTQGKQRGFYAQTLEMLGFGRGENYKNNFQLTKNSVVRVNAPDDHRWLDGADLGKIKAIKNTGEKSNPVTMFWIQAKAGFCKLIEYMGGTEIGGGYLTNSFHKPSAPCEFDRVSYGLDMFVHKDAVPHPTDKEADNIFEAGEMAIVMNKGGKNSGFVASIGLSQVLFNKSFEHSKKYPLTEFEQGLLLRRHGDGVSLLPNGNFRSDGRMDGAININGIKTSRVELENSIKDFLQKSKGSEIAKDFVRVAVYDVANPQGGENKVIVHVEMNNPENHRNLEQMRKVFGNAFANINPGFKSAVADVVVAPVIATASAKTQHKIMIQSYMDNHYHRLVEGISKDTQVA